MPDTPIPEVVVTGGAGDLGSAIAAEFAQAGHTVVAPSRAALDVAEPDSIKQFFFGRDVGLLVCAAGVTRDALLARLSPAEWEECWSVNYRGAWACARAVLPGMIARKSGHIVFVSSHSAVHPPPGQAAYAAAKAALLGLTEDLAKRHGCDDIRVNAVLPGFLETRMTSSVTPERRRDVIAAHTLGRLNTCAEVARFVRFLHDQLPHTSGQCFQLDSRPGHP